MRTISFLASHGGSAAKTIIETIERKELVANIGVVITNNIDSQIYRWCTENQIRIFHVSGITHPDENEKDKEILRLLLKYQTDLVILSGYMKKVGPRTLLALNNKILNIHPSLLPLHGGKGMYGDKVHQSVLANKDVQSGATVHFINAEYDEGNIIAQQAVSVLENETLESLKNKIQSIEGQLYIEAIRKMA